MSPCRGHEMPSHLCSSLLPNLMQKSYTIPYKSLANSLTTSRMEAAGEQVAWQVDGLRALWSGSLPVHLPQTSPIVVDPTRSFGLFVHQFEVLLLHDSDKDVMRWFGNAQLLVTLLLLIFVIKNVMWTSGVDVSWFFIFNLWEEWSIGDYCYVHED